MKPEKIRLAEEEEGAASVMAVEAAGQGLAIVIDKIDTEPSHLLQEYFKTKGSKF